MKSPWTQRSLPSDILEEPVLGRNELMGVEVLGDRGEVSCFTSQEDRGRNAERSPRWNLREMGHQGQYGQPLPGDSHAWHQKIGYGLQP